MDGSALTVLQLAAACILSVMHVIMPLLRSSTFYFDGDAEVSKRLRSASLSSRRLYSRKVLGPSLATCIPSVCFTRRVPQASEVGIQSIHINVSLFIDYQYVQQHPLFHRSFQLTADQAFCGGKGSPTSKTAKPVLD